MMMLMMTGEEVIAPTTELELHHIKETYETV